MKKQTRIRRNRFWVWWNDGPVRIGLAEDQEIQFGTGGPTEEGWTMTSESYRIEGTRVIRECITDATDCDGRLRTHVVLNCAIHRLAAGNIDSKDTGVVYPVWDRVRCT